MISLGRTACLLYCRWLSLETDFHRTAKSAFITHIYEFECVSVHVYNVCSVCLAFIREMDEQFNKK